MANLKKESQIQLRMAGIIAQLTAAARKRKGRKQITSAKCLYTLEVGQSSYTWNIGVNDDNFQEFDRGGFQPVVHNEFLVEQAMWRQGGDENDPKKDVTGSTLHRDVREDPFRLVPPLFGHCPNSDYTPPSTLVHFFSGVILPFYHFYHF